MNASSSGPNFEDEPSDSDSRDCVNIIIDGPGDTTVRPARPKLLALLLAEREKIARWQAELDKQLAADQTPKEEYPNSGTP